MSHPVNDLAQSSENSLQLVEIAEFNGDLAGSLLVAANGDGSTDAVGNFFLQAQQVAVDRLIGCLLGRVGGLLDEILGFAHRHSSLHDPLRDGDLLGSTQWEQ